MFVCSHMILQVCIPIVSSRLVMKMVKVKTLLNLLPLLWNCSSHSLQPSHNSTGGDTDAGILDSRGLHSLNVSVITTCFLTAAFFAVFT